MVRISVPQTVEQLRTLIDRVRADGETVQLLDGTQIVAEMRPPEPASPQPRQIGLAKGVFTVPKSFFDPLPEEVLSGFWGK
jgi:antitoxin (DNA-binding transcriptional repressor) of toxin-antitoxin stability system